MKNLKNYVLCLICFLNLSYVYANDTDKLIVACYGMQTPVKSNCVIKHNVPKSNIKIDFEKE